MTLRLVALMLMLAPGGPLAAEQRPAEMARAALGQLQDASAQLERAETARDRVAALTAVIRSYESGLAGLRAGLRDAIETERTLSRDLGAREAEIARLLGPLQSLGRGDTPETLIHPAGPLGAARAGMLLAAITPALDAQSADLRTDLVEVAALRRLREEAEAALTEGLAGAQQARAELARAIEARTELPMRFVEDPVRTAILLSSTQSLREFAAGLDLITEEEAPEDLPPVTGLKGALPLPASGEILERAGEADAGDSLRPGIALATAPRALVTAPATATLRYSGPLLDYGQVAILEPQNDVLLVFAGLGTVYGRIGEVLEAGAPVGIMPGEDPLSGDIVSPIGDRAGNPRTETLYIEVREGDAPVDPLTWFSTDKG